MFGEMKSNERVSFSDNWGFSERHLPAVRRELAMLPAGLFLDFATADAERDKTEATDIVLEVDRRGMMAVRVRARRYWRDHEDDGDWSIRFKSRYGGRTEAHKMIDGWCDWYFIGFSDGHNDLYRWFLLDLYRVREEGIFPDTMDETAWRALGWLGPHDNADGTAGIYFPISKLLELGCVMMANAEG